MACVTACAPLTIARYSYDGTAGGQLDNVVEMHRWTGILTHKANTRRRGLLVQSEIIIIIIIIIFINSSKKLNGGKNKLTCHYFKTVYDCFSLKKQKPPKKSPTHVPMTLWLLWFHQ